MKAYLKKARFAFGLGQLVVAIMMTITDSKYWVFPALVMGLFLAGYVLVQYDKGIQMELTPEIYESSKNFHEHAKTVLFLLITITSLVGSLLIV